MSAHTADPALQEQASIAVAAPDTPAMQRAEPRGFRADIQGLRAIAVALVLVFHLWPDQLTGGYVGVDVFFVISGYLITSHLLQRPPASGRDVAQFWSRRLRRLLPAALLVLLVTLLASRLIAPETHWGNTAREVIAATLYAENWWLAQNSVDYLAAENAPSPIQHFWSLSVEEQFYAFWPLLILGLVLLARRQGRPVFRSILAGLATVVVLSLGYSIYATWQDPASAYFVTPTRIWELGAGALLAVAQAARSAQTTARKGPGLTPGASALLAWTGFAAIAATAVTFSSATPFPSWRGLLPILGTVVVIAAHAGTAGISPTRILRLRPIQWLGDISYSVYLWHWPLIVLLPHVGGQLGWLDKTVILGASLILGTLSKNYVEDVFRFGRRSPSIRRTYTLAALGMAFVVGLATLQLLELSSREAAAKREVQRAVASGDPCFGANALKNPEACAARYDGTIVPAPAQAALDKSDAYAVASGGKDCWSSTPKFPTITCEFGDPEATVNVALVGNSHAGQWLTPLQQVARDRGWRITTYLASRCALVPVQQRLSTAAYSAACSRWVDNVSNEVQGNQFDLVFLTNRMSVQASGTKSAEESIAAYRDGYQQLLRDWSRSGVQVVALRDTPAPVAGGIRSIPDCVAGHREDLTKCSGPRDVWEPVEPLVSAASAIDSPRVHLADLNDRICTAEVCSAVVGGVIVYFDGSHLTATYARTLTPFLDQAAIKALGQR
jgi:peptidoglycan/LPS O-acetylase OafA/YrhL